MRISHLFSLLAAAALSIFTPSPAQAGPEDGRMEIKPLTEGVWLHTSYGRLSSGAWYPSNGLVVVVDEQAWIIDTPWPEKDTPRLVAWIREQGWEPAGSLSTHFHDDRASGIGWLNGQAIPTWASYRTNAQLAERGQALASKSFDSAEHAFVEDQVVVFHPGAGHTRDNVVAWLPRHGILFGGCLVRSMSTSSMGNVADASLADWPVSITRLMQRFPDVETVLPGHGEPGGQELLQHTLRLARKH